MLNIQVQCVPAKILQNNPVTPVNIRGFGAYLSDSCAMTFSLQGKINITAWSGLMDVVGPASACLPLINSTALSAPDLPSPQLPVAVGFALDYWTVSAVFCSGYQRVFSARAGLDLRLGRAMPTLENLIYIPGHPLEQYVLNG